MNMRIAPEISIKHFAGRPEGEIPKSEVFHNDHPTGKIVTGAWLEAAIKCGTQYLLLTTNDCAFSETLSIQLLDANFEQLDFAYLWTWLSDGCFSSLHIEEPDKVCFEFSGEYEWTVKILPRQSLRIPLVSEPLGVTRPFGFSRHFVIRRAPKVEKATHKIEHITESQKAVRR